MKFFRKSSAKSGFESLNVIKYPFKLKSRIEKLDKKTGFNKGSLEELEKIFTNFVSIFQKT